jgi:uncharacterized protein involved in exopolysaccharide biosynthesis
VVADLSLVEALDATLRRKWFVILCATCGMALGVLIGLLSRPIYQAEVLLAVQGSSGGGLQALSRSFSGLASLAGIELPGGSDNNRSSAIATLSSHKLLELFLADEKVRETILRETSGPAWFGSSTKEVSRWELAQRFRRYFAVAEEKDSGLVRVSTFWFDPDTASRWANQLVQMADQVLREQSLSTSRQRIEHLQKEYEQAAVVPVRTAISNVLENEFRNLTIAQVDREFAFHVIDPAVSHERPVRPRKALIALAFGLLGFVLGCTVAILRAARAKALR